MNRKVATAISYIFHPAIFALLAPFLFVYRTTENFWYGMKWAGFSAGFLLVVFIGVLLLRKERLISDIDISDKKDRHIFYSLTLLTAVIYYISSLIFKGVFFSLSIVSLGLILGIVLFDLVTYYRKVSIHVAVVTASVVSVAILFGVPAFLASVWMIPVVAIARIRLGRHTPKEAAAGMMLGIFIPVVTFLISRLIP